MNTTKHRHLAAVVSAVAVTPMLRWLILNHSVKPGQPWRTRCSCGHRLWPSACRPSGRCRTCGTTPGPPGYLIETITVIAVAIAVLPARGIWEAAAAVWWTAGAVMLAIIDARVRRLPHRINAATAAGFIGLLAVAGDAPVLVRVMAGATLAAAVFALAAFLRPGQLGGGDIGLAVPVAAFLAAHSWMALLYGYLAGFAAAAAFLTVARIARRSMRTVPLGPFLLAGALVIAQL